MAAELAASVDRDKHHLTPRLSSCRLPGHARHSWIRGAAPHLSPRLCGECARVRARVHAQCVYKMLVVVRQGAQPTPARLIPASLVTSAKHLLHTQPHSGVRCW